MTTDNKIDNAQLTPQTDSEGRPIVVVRPRNYSPPVGVDTSEAAIDDVTDENSDVAKEPEQSLPVVTDPTPVDETPKEDTSTPVTPQTGQYFKQIDTALRSGASRDQVKEYMTQQLGMSNDDADLEIIQSVADRVNKARQNGATDEDVKNYLIENNYDGSVIDSALQYANRNNDYKQTDYNPSAYSKDQQEEANATDLADLYKNIYTKYSTYGKSILGVAGFDQSGLEARREIDQLNTATVNFLNKKGIEASQDPKTGEVLIKTKQGNTVPLDSSMLNSIFNSKGEIMGGIEGALAGARVGNMAPLRARPFTVPGGALAGGMLGAASGRAYDLMVNSMQIKEQLEAKVYYDQMKQAGIADAVGSVLGAAVLKTGAAGYKSILKAYDYVSAGNVKGAAKYLTEALHLTPDQASDITDKFLATLENPLTRSGAFRKNIPLNRQEQTIAALLSTQQGAEGIVRQAASKDPKLAQSMIMNIDSRAKDIRGQIDKLADPNVGALVRDNLNEYTKDVGKFYGAVKQQAVDAINGTDFRFDIDKTSIVPVMEAIDKNLQQVKNLDIYSNNVSAIANATSDRTFGGLVELRQVVNNFKYSKSGLSALDKKALNTVINKIDNQIEKAAKQYMGADSKQWLANWSKAKSEYTKMKLLEDNVMYNSITKSANEAGIQRALNRYGNDLDVDTDTFNEVVDRLAPLTRAKVEGAAIKNLTSKFTYGNATEFQAIQLPALAESLKQLNLKTPEAKYLVDTVDQMSRIYKNDKALSGLSGNLSVPRYGNAILTDAESRVKASIVQAVYDYTRKLVPGKKGSMIALANYTDRVLENPMNFKSVEQLVGAMPQSSQPTMRSLISQLRQQAAKSGNITPPATQRMYKQTTTGKLSTTSGALGKGVYLVDKVANPNPASKVVGHDVDISKLATLENISNLVGKEVSEKDIRTIPDIQQKLRDAGYLGIRVEGKAMLFPETIVGETLRRPTDTFKKE